MCLPPQEGAELLEGEDLGKTRAETAAVKEVEKESPQKPRVPRDTTMVATAQVGLLHDYAVYTCVCVRVCVRMCLSCTSTCMYAFIRVHACLLCVHLCHFISLHVHMCNE